MIGLDGPVKWKPGKVPIAVVMITLNEGHNLQGALDNLVGWAQEVFVVDSYSRDCTIDIALRYGIHVVQRGFNGFGDQWNFAVRESPITAPWTMKLDPDERLSEELKDAIEIAILRGEHRAYNVTRHLHFLGRRLPVTQSILRIWRTGECQFSDVQVNEYPMVQGPIGSLRGALDHFDSPNLHHWFAKQNHYTTAEAEGQFLGRSLAVKPDLFRGPLHRRMWLKQKFWRFPFRYSLLFLYHYIALAAWRAGRAGFYWALLRTHVYRQWEIKLFEMTVQGAAYVKVPESAGSPDPRVTQISK